VKNVQNSKESLSPNREMGKLIK